MLDFQLSPRRVFDRRLSLLLAVSDLLVCCLAVILAYEIRAIVPTSMLAPIRHDVWMYVSALPVITCLWFIAFNSFGLYEVRRFVSAFSEMTAVFRAVSTAVLLVAAASFLSHKDYSRATLLIFWTVGLTLNLVSRALLRSYAEAVGSREETRARAVVLGCGDLGALVARRIREYQLLGYELVGFVAVADPPPDVEGYRVLGCIDELAGIVREHDVDEILVASPDIDPGLLMSAVQSCEGLRVVFHLVAGPLHVLTRHTEISGLADLPVIELPQPSFPAWQCVIKRGLDVIASAVLLVALSPVMLLAALVAHRETGGTVIFRQQRVGYRGRLFTMYKLRTMKCDADPYAEAPGSADDPRVGPVGRWLRRFSIDELPQLFNVLRGDMSLVGPRPEMPQIVEEYEPWQRRRLDVKPGLTGLWQILGRKEMPLRDNIEVDFYYILNWSIWLDLTILLKTIPAVLGGRGAY
ncbi:MAG: sugar transferase [Acidobacteriota bacterium]|nr:sugar transferase [Acidobacteriota bacterium]